MHFGLVPDVTHDVVRLPIATDLLADNRHLALVRHLLILTHGTLCRRLSVRPDTLSRTDSSIMKAATLACTLLILLALVQTFDARELKHGQRAATITS